MTAPVRSPAEWAAIAGQLGNAEIDVMAHALGWPDTLNIRRPRGVVRWGNPWRNRFIAQAGHRDFDRLSVLCELGLMERDGDTYCVTKVGRAVTRAVLLIHHAVAP